MRTSVNLAFKGLLVPPHISSAFALLVTLSAGTRWFISRLRRKIKWLQLWCYSQGSCCSSLLKNQKENLNKSEICAFPTWCSNFQLLCLWNLSINQKEVFAYLEKTEIRKLGYISEHSLVAQLSPARSPRNPSPPSPPRKVGEGFLLSSFASHTSAFLSPAHSTFVIATKQTKLC